MATDRGRHPLRRRAHLVAQYVKCPAPGDIVVEYIGRQGNWRLCRSELGTTAITAQSLSLLLRCLRSAQRRERVDGLGLRSPFNSTLLASLQSHV